MTHVHSRIFMARARGIRQLYQSCILSHDHPLDPGAGPSSRNVVGDRRRSRRCVIPKVGLQPLAPPLRMLPPPVRRETLFHVNLTECGSHPDNVTSPRVRRSFPSPHNRHSLPKACSSYSCDVPFRKYLGLHASCMRMSDLVRRASQEMNGLLRAYLRRLEYSVGSCTSYLQWRIRQSHLHSSSRSL